MSQLGPESAVHNKDGTTTLATEDYKKLLDKTEHYRLFIDAIQVLDTASELSDYEALKAAYDLLPKSSAGLSGL